MPHSGATCKKIEFAFDTDDDTADAIAHEMMEDLSLSAEEAQSIATKIRLEIQRIASGGALPQPHPSLPPSSTGGMLPSPDGGHDASGGSGSRRPSVESVTPTDASSRAGGGVGASTSTGGSEPNSARPPLPPMPPLPSPLPSMAGQDLRADLTSARNSQAEPPSIPGDLAARPSSSGGGAAGMIAGGSNAGGVHKSGGQTPTLESSSAKAPSIYALIEAMREVHEEEANASTVSKATQ